MKKLNKFFILAGVIVALGASVAYAAEYKTPSQTLAVLTGKTEDEVNKERAQGKTYGEIADESGKLKEFQDSRLESKKIMLQEKVEQGIITQQEADDFYNQMKEAQAYCLENGASGRRAGNGLGLGRGQGQGQGRGLGRGMGFGCR